MAKLCSSHEMRCTNHIKFNLSKTKIGLRELNKIISQFHAHSVHQNSVEIYWAEIYQGRLFLGPRYIGDDF